MRQFRLRGLPLRQRPILTVTTRERAPWIHENPRGGEGGHCPKSGDSPSGTAPPNLRLGRRSALGSSHGSRRPPRRIHHRHDALSQRSRERRPCCDHRRQIGVARSGKLRRRGRIRSNCAAFCAASVVTADFPACFVTGSNPVSPIPAVSTAPQAAPTGTKSRAIRAGWRLACSALPGLARRSLQPALQLSQPSASAGYLRQLASGTPDVAHRGPSEQARAGVAVRKGVTAPITSRCSPGPGGTSRPAPRWRRCRPRCSRCPAPRWPRPCPCRAS